MRQGLAVALAVAGGLVAVPGVQAGVATNVAGTLTYTATAGEDNRVLVERVGASTVVVRDSGADVLLGLPGCPSAGPDAIRCEGVASAVIALGDGDDQLGVTGGMRLSADGGPGSDLLAGGPGDEALHGGDGNDLLGGGGGADELDGGPGADIVEYRGRVGGVVVTLDESRNDGEPGELDLVVGVEAVVGGAGPDVLDGDEGPNALYGGPGNDSLNGDGGEDRIDGGDGRDGVNALDPAGDPDEVECGEGRDRVFGDDADGVRGDCEKVGRGAVAGVAIGSRVEPAAPPPVLGESVVLEPLSGVVLVTPPEPGSPPRTRQEVPAAPAVPLSAESNVPVGSVVDTRFGTVEMTVAVDRETATESGRFHSGPFQVFQDPVAGAFADLELRGGKSFSACPAGQKGPGVARAAARRKVVRRLWSEAKGRFRTRGRFASATVRGTRWLTADRCDGTLVTVREGAVEVRDLTTGRPVLVRAGESRLVRSG